ncbi:LOW QUALITY PROTEIN: hypothetical protein V2J09_021336, partial [Rumex salicifolius]
IASLHSTHGAIGVKEFFVHRWIAWTVRNKKLCDPEFTNIDVLRIGFKKLISNFDSFQASLVMLGSMAPSIPPSVHGNWVAPPAGKLKLHVDACTSVGDFGLGAITRNSDGDILLVASKRTHGFGGPFLSEGLACRCGINMPIRWGFLDLILNPTASNIYLR